MSASELRTGKFVSAPRLDLGLLVERIYWRCKRHSTPASGLAAHHLADAIAKDIESVVLKDSPQVEIEP